MRIRGRGLLGTTHRRTRHFVRLARSAMGPFTPMDGGADVLEREYRDGEWDYLVDAREAARFHVVAGYCLRTAAAPRVLEVGCGEGTLADRLTPQRYSEFVGVDVADTAVGRARARSLVNAEFVAADAMEYVPGSEGKFDAIVFNEVLEYFPDPLAAVRRFEPWLAPGGEIVVSQFRSADNARTRRIWRFLHARYETRLRTVVQTDGLTWTVEALVPAPASAR